MAEPTTRRLAYLCLEAPIEGQASYVHVKEIVEGLRRRGWRVDVFSPSYSNDARRPSLVMRLREYVQLQATLVARSGDYDGIYIRAHPLAFPVALIAYLRSRKIIHEINGTWEDLYVAHKGARPYWRVLNALQRFQYRWATGLIAVTPQLKVWLGQITAPHTPPVEIVPNGANVDMFEPGANNDLELPEHYVVFFGGLTKWHGVDAMIAALASDAWPDGISMVIVGDGPELSKLRALAETDKRIVLLGRLPYLDVPGAVSKALAGLVPISDPGGRSMLAGLAPLKLFEVLASGIPAIVSDFPYQAELVREGNFGLVVPPDDGRALAQAVAELAGDRDKARKMGQRARQFICAEHSWDHRASDTSAFLQRLIKVPVRKSI